MVLFHTIESHDSSSPTDARAVLDFKSDLICNWYDRELNRIYCKSMLSFRDSAGNISITFSYHFQVLKSSIVLLGGDESCHLKLCMISSKR